jgi:uncharacterized membrane protein
MSNVTGNIIALIIWGTLAYLLITNIDIHIFNIITWFAGCFILTGILMFISQGDFVDELGGALVMIPVLAIWSMFCLIAFGICHVEAWDVISQIRLSGKIGW